MDLEAVEEEDMYFFHQHGDKQNKRRAIQTRMPSHWAGNAKLRGLGRRPQGCGEGSLNVSPTKRSVFSGRRDR
jgi:hypothetical protein